MGRAPSLFSIPFAKQIAEVVKKNGSKVALFPPLTRAETGEIYVTTLGERLISELADNLEFRGVKVLWGAGLERALLMNNRSFRSYVDAPSAVALGARLAVPLVVTGKIEHRVFSAIRRDWALNINLMAVASDGSGGKAVVQKSFSTGPTYVQLRRLFDRKSEVAVGEEVKKAEPTLVNELRSSAQALAAKIRKALGRSSRRVALFPVAVEGRGIPLMVHRSLGDVVEQRYRQTVTDLSTKQRAAVARLEVQKRNLMKRANTLEQRLADLKKAGAKGSRALAELRGKREAVRRHLAALRGDLLNQRVKAAQAKAALTESKQALEQGKAARERLRKLLDAVNGKKNQGGALLSKELRVLEQSVASIHAIQQKIARRFKAAEEAAAKARAAASAEAQRLSSIVESTIAKIPGVKPSSKPSKARSEARPVGLGAGLFAYEKALSQKDVLLEMAGIRSALARAIAERGKLLDLQSKAKKERLVSLKKSLAGWETKLKDLEKDLETKKLAFADLSSKLSKTQGLIGETQAELQGLDAKVAALSKGQDRLDPKLTRAVALADQIARARAGLEEALVQEKLRDPRSEALASGPMELGGQRFESLAQARMRIEELRRRAIQEAHRGLRGQLLALLQGALAERGLRVRVLGQDLKEAPRAELAVQPSFKKIGDRFEFAAHFVGAGAPGMRPSVTLDPRWTPLLQEAIQSGNTPSRQRSRKK